MHCVFIPRNMPPTLAVSSLALRDDVTTLRDVCLREILGMLFNFFIFVYFAYLYSFVVFYKGNRKAYTYLPFVESHILL